MDSENIIKLEQMKRYFFDEETTTKFIQYLMKKATVIAPHKKGEVSYSFEEVTDVTKIVVDYPRTIQPLKKYFLPRWSGRLNLYSTCTHPFYGRQ